MKLKVILYKRPNMFIVNENMYNMLGVGELKNMYTIENYKTKHKDLILFYPERFLNILEIRCLISRIENAGFENVEITTHSAYLITTVKSENVGVVDDESIPEDPTIFKYSNDDSGMPYDGGLGVLMGG